MVYTTKLKESLIFSELLIFFLFFLYIITLQKRERFYKIKQNHRNFLKIFFYNLMFEIVYYKSLSDSNWSENDYNWACFCSNGNLTQKYNLFMSAMPWKLHISFMWFYAINTSLTRCKIDLHHHVYHLYKSNNICTYTY